MATTKIWPVRGWLGQVVIYVENPLKTEKPKFVGDLNSDEKEVEGLVDVIDYAMSTNKTVGKESTDTQHHFVSGVNCTPHSARTEMMAAKKRYEKQGGIVAFHALQSFSPGEVCPEVAHEIGMKLANQLWADRFQVIVATHLDKGHIHNHFVINSVSHTDGLRFRSNKTSYKKLRDSSDALCKEYELSVIENPKRGKTKHHLEWQADKQGKPTWRGTIKGDVDECIEKARTKEQFFKNLETLGYEYKVGKDISVRPAGRERFFRLERNLGEDYSSEAIGKRIAQGKTRGQVLPVPKYRAPNFVPPKKMPVCLRGSIVSLHRRYLYLFGYYQTHGNKSTNARMHYLLREDLRQLDAYIEDTKLLGREDIHTNAELSSFEKSCLQKIDELVQKRLELKREIRKAAGTDKPYTTKDNPKYQDINSKLKTLRKELRQVSRIRKRSNTLLSRIERIEKDEEKKLHKTKSVNEVNNGRNRTSNRSNVKDSSFR